MFVSFRIRTEAKGGAWCPLGVIDKDSYEYLQIDLGKLMVITKVEVQGRFANGQVGNIWSTKVHLLYSYFTNIYYNWKHL